MNTTKLEYNPNFFMNIIKGISLAFITTLIGIFILAIILTYTNVSENIIPTTIISITFLSILIGSFISMKKMTQKGLINGAVIGGIYVILLYLISSILNTGFSMNIYTLITIITGTIAGIIGGIVGVNIN